MGFQAAPAQLFYDFSLEEHVPVDPAQELDLLGIGRGVVDRRAFMRRSCWKGRFSNPRMWWRS